MSQLDADGHDTTALREELERLLDVVALAVPAYRVEPPLLLPAPRFSPGHETQRPEKLAESCR
jgi:hypothetical protein